MIIPEFTSNDEALEWAARLIEEVGLSDIGGILAKRKRDREDAALRIRTIEDTRKRCAEHIRAFKQRPELSARQVLRQIADTPKEMHAMELIDAWPLAWKGWLNIFCTIRCNSNSVPPEVKYHIELTEKGRKVLEGDGSQGAGVNISSGASDAEQP